jgi:hypothetical protein
VLGVVCLQSAFGDDGLKQPGWAVVALIELSVLPLAVRRSRPLAVLAMTLAAAIVGDLWFSGFLLPGPLIALYTVAAHCERRVALAAVVATAVALLVPALAGRGVSSAGFAVAMYAAFAVAWTWATTCAPAGRIWPRWRRVPSAWSAIARSAHGERWPRSARGSRGSCTTSSRTT